MNGFYSKYVKDICYLNVYSKQKKHNDYHEKAAKKCGLISTQKLIVRRKIKSKRDYRPYDPKLACLDDTLKHFRKYLKPENVKRLEQKLQTLMEHAR